MSFSLDLPRWKLEDDGSYTRTYRGALMVVEEFPHGWWWSAAFETGLVLIPSGSGAASGFTNSYPTAHAAKCACTRAVKEAEG